MAPPGNTCAAFKRAAEIHQLLARERAAKESLGAAVAAAGFAVFLLAKDCRVLFANAKAESFVRCQTGFRYEHGRLAAARDLPLPATLMDVVNFYDQRFSIGFTDQQKEDLVNFLKAL